MDPYNDSHSSEIAAAMERFTRDPAVLQEPSYRIRNSECRHIIIQRSKDNTQNAKFHHKWWYTHYWSAMNLAEHLLPPLQRRSNYFKSIARYMANLESALELTRDFATCAHMINEQVARLFPTVLRIQLNYKRNYHDLNHIRAYFVAYTGVLLCELWGLDQLDEAVEAGTLEPTLYELHQWIYLEMFLTDQLDQTLYSEACIGIACLAAEDIVEYWDRKLESLVTSWDNDFERAVILREHERNLAAKVEELKAAIGPRITQDPSNRRLSLGDPETFISIDDL